MPSPLHIYKRRKKPKRRKKAGMDDIPVSSFSDIAFLLIIFFILVTTLQKTQGFLSDIPSGEQTQQEQSEKNNTVQINDDNIVFNDKDVGPKSLRAELQALKLHEREGEGKVVVLEATGNVQYQLYYEVMSIISASGGAIAIVKEDKSQK